MTAAAHAPSSYAKPTGPRTERGKAVAARNATTHGLFARDIVLPCLGEDPEGYQQILDELNAQLNPKNLLERHYVEKIAAASWRLRRLHRWQAQIFEDNTLTEDQRLDKLDKVLRHENHLHRQIDTSVKMLNKDVPHLHTSRARDEARRGLLRTDRECRRDPEADLEVTVEADRLLRPLTASPTVDYAKLDAAALPDDLENRELKKCENEPSEPDPSAWHVEWEKRENERLLATLDHDVSSVDATGRPVYIDDSLWSQMQRQIELGYPSRAADYSEWARRDFLRDQELARAFLAAQMDNS